LGKGDFLPKELSVDALLRKRDHLERLRLALPGRMWKVQEEITKRTAPPVSLLTLTQRQHEVLQKVRERKSNKEIGLELNIAERTVKFHVSRLLKKYGKSSRQEIMI
jgi:DNA-binding NarL/FixJ family response regulator